MGSVRCAALAPIGGRRVRELDVPGDVIGRQARPRPRRCARRTAMVPSGLVAVTIQRSPFFTQLLPVVSEPVVLAGHDLVADARHLPVSDPQPLVGDGSRGSPGRLSPGG